ncbi:hypothetical protein QMT40_003001 [Parvibaculaceae bacterium PLY_AMNH_Bact1]|nr:hypothetical protein QMT40_003001 [Parvibaculaceae bacterium PLY_AMNH_Bact1]
MASPRHQPGLLAAIAEITDQASADLIAAEWGGRALYLPAKVKRDHRLVELLGREKAMLICKEIGSGNVMVPMSDMAGPKKRRRMVAELLDKDASHSEAARAAGVHTRTVERVAAKQRRHRKRKPSGSQGRLL